MDLGSTLGKILQRSAQGQAWEHLGNVKLKLLFARSTDATFVFSLLSFLTPQSGIYYDQRNFSSLGYSKPVPSYHVWVCLLFLYKYNYLNKICICGFAYLCHVTLTYLYDTCNYYSEKW